MATFGAIKYTLKMLRTRRGGISIDGIPISGQQQQNNSGIYEVFFTDTQVVEVDISNQAASIIGGKTGSFEETIASNPLLKSVVGSTSAELTWNKLKKALQGQSMVDLTAQLPDISNANTMTIDYDKIKEVYFKKQSLFGVSDYDLMFNTGLLQTHEVIVTADSVDQIKQLLSKTPLAQKLK